MAISQLILLNWEILNEKIYINKAPTSNGSGYNSNWALYIISSNAFWARSHSPL